MMSGEEKHDLKWYVFRLQSAATLLTVLAMMGITQWIRMEFKDIHYAAKQTPILERRINVTDSNVRELSKFVNDSVINKIFVYARGKRR